MASGKSCFRQQSGMRAITTVDDIDPRVPLMGSIRVP